MKHTLLILVVAAVLGFPASLLAKTPIVGKVKKIVPKVTLGIKAGLNLQQTSGNLADNAFNAGFLGGVFVGLTKKKIGVQVEGLVKSAKVDYQPSFSPGTGASVKYHVNTVSLNIPVLFEYKLFWRIWGQVGPQFSTILTAEESSKDVKKQFNTTNFDGVIGLQAILPAHFTLSARYILGLTNMNKTVVTYNGAVDTWNERSVQIALGFSFI
jgi:hypothetical protein